MKTNTITAKIQQAESYSALQAARQNLDKLLGEIRPSKEELDGIRAELHALREKIPQSDSALALVQGDPSILRDLNRRKELGERAEGLKAEIAASGEAIDLQNQVIRRLEAKVSAEAAGALRPEHQRIAEAIRDAIQALMDGFREDNALHQMLVDLGLNSSTLPALTIPYFLPENGESKSDFWLGRARAAGFELADWT